MGDIVEPATHAPAPTPALPLLFSQKALDASRTEILILASGILFLASQVCLLVWFLSRRAPGQKEQRKVAIDLPHEAVPIKSPSDDAGTHEDSATGNSNGNGDSTFRLRRRSTWGGRSAHPGSQARGRRKSAGSRRNVHDSDEDGNEEGDKEEQGVHTSPRSLGLELEADHIALAAFGDMGRMAAALAAPAALPPPSATGREDDGGSDGGGAQDTELRGFDPRQALGEAGLLAASIERPRSPRSPRVLAADQAAMMDALCAEKGEEGGWQAAAPSPVGGVEGVLPALGPGFDDPLGVNRLVALSGRDEDDREGIELESRDGGRQDV